LDTLLDSRLLLVQIEIVSLPQKVHEPPKFDAPRLGLPERIVDGFIEPVVAHGEFREFVHVLVSLWER
jgi:hypothetical protein